MAAESAIASKNLINMTNVLNLCHPNKDKIVYNKLNSAISLFK